MTKNVKDLARSEEGEAQQKQNNEGGPAKDLLASIMKSIHFYQQQGQTRLTLTTKK